MQGESEVASINMVYGAAGTGTRAMTSSSSLAAVLILPLLFKLDGIWWATIVAELFAFLLSIGFVAAKKKKYGY